MNFDYSIKTLEDKLAKLEKDKATRLKKKPQTNTAKTDAHIEELKKTILVLNRLAKPVGGKSPLAQYRESFKKQKIPTTEEKRESGAIAITRYHNNNPKGVPLVTMVFAKDGSLLGTENPHASKK